MATHPSCSVPGHSIMEQKCCWTKSNQDSQERKVTSFLIEDILKMKPRCHRSETSVSPMSLFRPFAKTIPDSCPQQKYSTLEHGDIRLYLLAQQAQAFTAYQCPVLWKPLLLNNHKRKGGQIRFSVNQTCLLEKTFQKQKYLSPPERKKISDRLKLTERQVKTWFQNRRAKWRRQEFHPEDEHEDDDFCERAETVP